MWTVFKKRELMNGLFYKFICLLTLCFISCWSSPSGSSPNSSQQPVVSQESAERQLKRYTTYQTSLTNEDIMRSFVNEVRTYLQRYDSYDCYYLVRFEVFQDRNKQNMAWGTSTHEDILQWGAVYAIYLGIDNAQLSVEFSNTPFSTNDQDAQRIGTTRSGTVGGNRIRQHIVSTATSMFDESEMVLKMNNRNYSDESKTIFLAELVRILF